jgi:glycosyltransferase involved in cell wall biosynthesis
MGLLTVGLPVYNAMPYLRDTMTSLLAQTSDQFRILAIVDECADGSVEYMESLQDERLRVIFQKRIGLIPTLNRMLRDVDTPWLMRQDADDIAYPERVDRTLEYIKRFPDAGMFASIARYYPPERSLGVFRASRGTPEQLRSIVQRGYLLTFCHPSVTLNVAKTLAVGGYSETLEHAEDADLWWRLAIPYDVEIIPEILLGYRQHIGQATTQAMRQNLVDLLYVQYLLLSRLWDLKPRTKEAVRPHLEQFVPVRQLLAKEKLRRVNIRAAKRDFAGAIGFAFGAFATSPKFVLSRIWDEVSQEREIVNGINPGLFQKAKAQLWDLCAPAIDSAEEFSSSARKG